VGDAPIEDAPAQPQAEVPAVEAPPPSPPPAPVPALPDDDAALLPSLVDLWLNDFAAFDRTVRSFAASDGSGVRGAFRPATISPVGTATPPLSDRPRLAVLVSGPLGNFRETRQSWPLLRLGTAEVTVFVHSWSGVASTGEVGTVYDTTHVLLENAGDETFAGLSEACLAHYSLRTAWGLMSASGSAFDLVLRIPPSLMVYGVQDLDWTLIRQQSVAGNVFFTDDVKYRTGNRIAVGNRFAAGAPELMAAYAATFGRQQAQRWEHLPLYPEADEARTSLAATLFYACVDVQPMPHVLFGD
jgi:hypothetical protein